MVLAINPSAKISGKADIEDSIRGTRIEIGPDVVIDSFVKIKPVGGSGNVIIGARSFINPGCVLYSGNGIQIGEDVLVAANCTFAPVNHEYKRRDMTIVQQRFKPSKGGIIVEDDVWIGANCVILDGAHISKGCVVAAGSIVRGKLEPYKVYAGSPLAIVGERE